MVFFCFCQTSITPGEKHVLSCRNSMRMLSTNYFLISYALERKSEETNANPQTGLRKYHNEACLHLTLPQLLPCGLRESRSVWKWRCLYCSDGSVHRKMITLWTPRVVGSHLPDLQPRGKGSSPR